jgi:hypothetical protein
MAISGGATTAYQMWLEGDKVKVGDRGTRLSTLCDNPEIAVLKMFDRERPKVDRTWVAGGDVEKVRSLMREQQARRKYLQQQEEERRAHMFAKREW